MTSSNIFLGVTINPKTMKPVYVFKPAGGSDYSSRHAVIFVSDSNGTYQKMGDGYLDECGEYTRAVDGLDGIPRVHTPAGVAVKGGGFGTNLYVGCCMLATGESRRIYRLRGLCGSAEAIHSNHESRSYQASEWWRAAVKRGLADTRYVEGDEDEESDDTDVKDLADFTRGRYVTPVAKERARNAMAAIEELMQDYVEDLFRVTEVNIHYTTRISGGGEQTVDVLEFSTCMEQSLIAFLDPRDGGNDDNAWAEWGRLESESPQQAEGDKDVLLSLNLTDEDDDMIGWLIKEAKEYGATEAELDEMRVRARRRADPLPSLPLPFPEATGEPGGKEPPLELSWTRIPQPSADDKMGGPMSTTYDPVEAAREAVRAQRSSKARRRSEAYSAAFARRAKENPAPPSRVRRPGAKRTRSNPVEVSDRELERALRKVEERRARLGIADMADL